MFSVLTSLQIMCSCSPLRRTRPPPRLLAVLYRPVPARIFPMCPANPLLSLRAPRPALRRPSPRRRSSSRAQIPAPARPIRPDRSRSPMRRHRACSVPSRRTPNRSLRASRPCTDPRPLASRARCRRPHTHTHTGVYSPPRPRHSCARQWRGRSQRTHAKRPRQKQKHVLDVPHSALSPGRRHRAYRRRTG